jgi:hypothetical protein
MHYEELLSIRSSGMSEDFAHRLMQDPNSIPAMINQIENTNPVAAWRAAWVIDKLSEQHPQLLLPHHPRLLSILKTTSSNGVRRHITRILAGNFSKACEDGELVDLCLQWIFLPKIPVAVKANAMTLMLELTKIYPDLIPELKIAIEAGLETASPGYKSRARKVLQRL